MRKYLTPRAAPQAFRPPFTGGGRPEDTVATEERPPVSGEQESSAAWVAWSVRACVPKVAQLSCEKATAPSPRPHHKPGCLETRHSPARSTWMRAWRCRGAGRRSCFPGSAEALPRSTFCMSAGKAYTRAPARTPTYSAAEAESATASRRAVDELTRWRAQRLFCPRPARRPGGRSRPVAATMLRQASRRVLTRVAAAATRPVSHLSSVCVVAAPLSSLQACTSRVASSHQGHGRPACAVPA